MIIAITDHNRQVMILAEGFRPVQGVIKMNIQIIIICIGRTRSSSRTIPVDKGICFRVPGFHLRRKLFQQSVIFIDTILGIIRNTKRKFVFGKRTSHKTLYGFMSISRIGDHPRVLPVISAGCTHPGISVAAIFQRICQNG